MWFLKYYRLGLRLFLLFLLGSSFMGVAQTPKQFYVVVVGVSRYDGPGMNLNYAATDAEEFSLQMLRMGIPAKNIALLTNEEATRANILKAANNLYAYATAKDEIIFFFSGHGSYRCFIPYDKTNGVLWHSEVKATFKNSKAATKLLFADACYSGSMKSGKATPPPTTQRDIEKYYKNLTGENLQIAVFVSSRNNQTSIEDPTLKSGLFTYYLLQSLKGLGDSNQDRQITLKEMYDYVSKQVTLHDSGQVPVMFGKFNPNLVIVRYR